MLLFVVFCVSTIYLAVFILWFTILSYPHLHQKFLYLCYKNLSFSIKLLVMSYCLLLDLRFLSHIRGLPFFDWLLICSGSESTWIKINSVSVFSDCLFYSCTSIPGECLSGNIRSHYRYYVMYSISGSHLPSCILH